MNPGDLLRNRYRIEKALAAGGFGETYLAVDLDYPGQRQVVVKHLKPAQSDPKTLEIARRLFKAEAEVLAELGETSDRIPTLYAYFEEEGEFYLVQEFIEGQTLTAELKLAGGKLSEVQVIKILQEIFEGLQEVHLKDKIHRDLKPDNIIRRAKDGKLVLIDFGAVKEIRQISNVVDNVMASATVPIGTKGYMPMEQAMGFPRLASDVYAVGAIGIQCLTGQHPRELFEEDILVLRWQHLCQVSSGLAMVLEKMVVQHANNRYCDGMEAAGAVTLLAPKVTDLFLDVPEFQSTPIPNFPPPVALTSKDTTQQVSINSSVLTSNSISVNSRSRRIFLKWLGFAGVGMVGVIALSRLEKNSSTPEKSPSSPRFGATPQLTKIQFASVKLDSYGKIVDQPTGQAEIFAEDLGGGASLRMVKIPAGNFMMGSLVSEKERGNRESLQHQVTVTGFYLSQTLVTQRQWQVVMGNNPSHFKGDDKLPVDSVNWLDATDFCRKLSRSTGHTYRLPSEAEWEYACRAGTTTPFAFGETITPEVVNYNGNYVYGNGVKGDYRQKTNVVGRFPANAFGLYDMHGNLWEWCLDEYIDSYENTPIDGSTKKDIKYRDISKLHVLRGGSWYGDPGSCRSAFRDRCVIVDHHNFFGFRVVYSPTKT